MHYNNYHRHDCYSNLATLDCVSKPEDYIKRIKELGETNYFTTQHGWTGDVHQCYSLCKKNNLKCIVGAEVYYVDDRKKKDKSNYHLIIICLNRNGYHDLNRIISEANRTGYYYKPRIDKELLLSLNPENVVITTACVAGRLFKTLNYKTEFLMPVMQHFGKHFFLETQAHQAETQILYNKKIIQLHKKYNIPLIHANDSHYIYPNDAYYRNMFLKAKGIKYPEENGFILDYPDSDTIINRYHQQGVLSEDEIKEALKNTLIFDNCEDLQFDYKIKIPKIHKDTDSNIELKQIINSCWKVKRKEIPTEKWNEEKEAIKNEVKVIEDTGMADYFIDDYAITNRAVNHYNAFLTRTGRGSSVSFATNYILGFTQINRIVNNDIPLYPSRFMSKARILKTRNLPDIDLNMASKEDQDKFVQASKDILGNDEVYFMISYKPLQDSSAFRLWCKAKGLDISEYNDVAMDLDKYTKDNKWKQLIEESKIFRGVIESASPSPCSTLLYDKPISQEIGLMRLTDKTTGRLVYCACMDKHSADEYKFLKNDYLVVTVYTLIKQTCELANIKVPTINELEKLIDDKTWDIYAKGLTATVNQCDSDFARPMVMKYKPHSVAELSSFIAAIRPGFSMLNNFLNRKYYSTGVDQIDKLLESSHHYILFQENIMQFLIFCGIEEDFTYGIIKKISKKTITKDEFSNLKKTVRNGYIKRIHSDNGFDNIWTEMENASFYSFNSSHSLSYGYDSIYCAYLKSHYPLEYYTVALNQNRNNIDETNKITKELQYFKINIKPIQFRYSKADYYPDEATHSIYKGTASIKYFNSDVSDRLYSLRNQRFDTFIDFLKVNPCNSRQTEILIILNYFKEFGKSKKLFQIYKLFKNIYGKSQFKKTKLPCNENIIKKYATETDKTYKKINTSDLLKELCLQIPDKEFPIDMIIKAQNTYLGYIEYKDNKLKNYIAVMDMNTKYSPKLTAYNLSTGEISIMKISTKTFASQPFETGAILKILSQNERERYQKIEGKWCKIIGEYQTWIDAYQVVYR